ncbi:hypothetical protein BH11MYX1_BH11MYX1_36710 [soil metagenome]
MICPTDEALAALSAGELAEGEREQLVDHAAMCSACRDLVSAIAGVRGHHPGTALGAEGATIGRYRVLGAAGHGAMGIVLRAHDPVLDREVAIKMVRSSDAPVRILDEAQTLARIDHPNVVKVYDAGVVGDEVYVAMAFVEGPTLAQWNSDSVAERANVLATAGAGICAIHDVGLVHRDIKPDNIIVRAGRGVVVDLGLAKALVGGLGSGRAGTERYIAPEIRAGNGASPASDQYAWCKVVEEVLRDAPLDARQRAAISGLLARGLADDPGSRFPTLAAAITALEHAIDPRLRPRRRRLRLPLSGIALLGIGLGLLSIMRDPAPSDPCSHAVPMQWTIERPVIFARVSAAGGDANRVDAVLDARANVFAKLGTAACRTETADRTRGLRQVLCLEETWSESARLFPRLTRAEPHYVRDAVDELTFVLPLERCASGVVPAVVGPPSPADRAAVTAVTDELRAIRLAPRTPPAAKLVALRALAPRVTISTQTNEEFHIALADTYRRLGKSVEAGKELDTVVSLAETAGDDNTRTRALIDLLGGAFDRGDPDTEVKAKAAEDAAARLGNPGITAELGVSEGLALYTRGDVPHALAKLQRAEALLATVAIGANAQMISVLQNLGGMQQASGDLAAAGTTYDHGYELARARYGDASVETLSIRGARANNLVDQNQLLAGHRELAAVAAGLHAALGDAPPVMQSTAYLCEAELLIDAHRAPSCDDALELAEKVYGPGDPQLAWPLTLVGRAHIGTPRAVSPLERALAVSSGNQAAPTDHAVAAAWLALTFHALHRDPRRAAELAHDARIGLSNTPSAAPLLAQLDVVFGARGGKNH